jgi:hypothetical protein
MKPIDDNYITIQGWMVTALKLKGSELQLFALIHGFCQDGKSRFSGSISYIETWLNASRPTAIAALNRLTLAGWIVKHAGGVNQTNEYSVNWKAVNNAKEVVKKLYHQDETGSKETLPEVVKNLYQGSKESLPNIYSNTDKDNIESPPAQFLVTTVALETIEPAANEGSALAESWRPAADHMIKHIEATPGALQYNLKGERPLPANWRESVRERMRHFQAQGAWFKITVPKNGQLRRWEAEMCAAIAKWIDSTYNTQPGAQNNTPAPPVRASFTLPTKGQ